MCRLLKLLAFPALLLIAGTLRAAPCGAPVSNPDANPLTGRINVGSSGQNFTVFAQSTASFLDNTFTGPSEVVGNIGIAGHGNFSWSDGTIDGDVYMNSFGTFNMSGPAHFTTGHHERTHQDTGLGGGPLGMALTDYQNLSNNAASDPCTNNYTVNGSSTILTNVNITNTSQSMTLKGPPGQKVVINLQSFVMTSGTFTLEGTATTTFIINVQNQFSLNNSKIQLANLSGVVGSPTGVQASNVLFNIRSSGIQISLNQSGTQISMSGILLALRDKIALSGGKVDGRVIGNQVNITSGGQVISQ
jgi:hypothetical protein